MIRLSPLNEMNPSGDVLRSDRMMGALVLIASVFISTNGIGLRADVLPPAQERFSAPAGAEVPDFQRHVVPMIGRLGCNGRSCHGSFQGQGGFQLSLFGYDFSSDHNAITVLKGDSERHRVNVGEPSESLILHKPLEVTDHEGGQRFEPGSWQHHLLLRWIRGGATRGEHEQSLLRLEVTPSQLVFQKADEQQALRVVAVWKNGDREDVTCLSRFQVNDDSVAKVSKDGMVRGGNSGDTHVVAFYDNGVAAIPVLIPYSKSDRPALAADSEIDRAVAEKLARLGLEASKLCSDGEFIRRLSVDLTGTLPTPNEVRQFLADPDQEKRSRLIEALLARPAYAAWWANKLCDFTGNNPNQQSDVGQEFAVQWYRWIYARLRENMPYDELVSKIVLATGRERGMSYGEYANEMSSYFRETGAADFARRETMPHYWSRRTLESAEDKALAFSHSFLGLQLQCAQCHKHPFDRWSQTDFEEFTRFFESVRYGVAPDGLVEHRAMAKAGGARMTGGMMMRVGMEMLGKAEEGQTVPWREVYVEPPDGAANRVRLLGSGAVDLSEVDDPRSTLMEWMREPENPYFAKAFVNRVWANYFGMGIVDPPDDLNQANPPSNQALLTYLAEGFVSNGFDMKWLHRTIVSSDTYQRSWRPHRLNENDRRNFSRFLPRRLSAEVVYDALNQVTAADSEQESVRTDLERRAIGHLSMRMAGTYAMNVFGKPARATNCDCERSEATSLLQTLFLRNDIIVRNRLRASGWLREIEDRFGDRELSADESEGLVEEAYLRCFARYPETEEMMRAATHLSDSEAAKDGVEDLLWALINAKEFLMNH